MNRTMAFGVEPSNARYRLRLARYPAMAEILQREWQAKGNLRIADLACGKGRLKKYCGFNSSTWAGLDLQWTRLRKATSVPGLDLVRGDLAGRLPFRDGAFDVAVLSHVLEHLDLPHRAIREARRILRPGGLLIVGVPVYRPVLAELRRSLGGLFDFFAHLAGKHSHHHVQFFNRGSLLRLFEGFRMEDVRGFRFFRRSFAEPLENFRFYYRLHTAFGKRFPFWTSEVNVAARRIDPA